MLNQGKIVRCSWEKFQSISHDPDILYVIKDKGQIWMGDKCIADTPKDIWSLGIINTEVGKTAKITEVDEDGKPIAWEAVDGVEAFNRQGDWEQNDPEQPNYVQNRTHYKEIVTDQRLTLFISTVGEETSEETPYIIGTVFLSAVSASTKLDTTAESILYEAEMLKKLEDDTVLRANILLSSLPRIHIPAGVIGDTETFGYGDPALFNGYQESDSSITSNDIGFAIAYSEAEQYKWAVRINKDHVAANYQTIIAKFGNERVTNYHTLGEEYIPTTVPRAASAAADDILVVKAVDRLGRPTEWEAVEIPTETLTVNLTVGDDESITADKTFAEIKAAYDSGKIVIAKAGVECFPLIRIDDSIANFQVMLDNQVGVVKCESQDGSDTWGFDFMDMATVDDARSLGMSGASVGQIIKVKSVDISGKPTAWEAIDIPTEVFVIDLTEDSDGNITADKTYTQIKEAYDAGKSIFANYSGSRFTPCNCYFGDNFGIGGFASPDMSGIGYISLEYANGSSYWDYQYDNLSTTTDARSLGMYGASVGQIVKVKEVDTSGRPTKWEAATDSTPFIVEFGGSGTESDPYTSSHTYAQIMEAISAGRHVVGYSEYISTNVDSCYGAYFNLFNTQDAASFEFIDSNRMFRISISVSDDFGVQVYGSYLDAKSYIYGGVKADDAEETDTQPVRKGADGKLYTSIPQSNWDQNDSLQSDYIKNRTHKREEVLVPSFTLRGTARATAAGAKIKEFTVDSKTGERPTGMSVYCRISGDPPILLPKIWIPSYTIDEYSTDGYGDPSLFSSEAHVDGAPSVHDNGLDIGVGYTSAEPNGWIIRVSSDSKYFDYEEEIELEFGTSYETVYTPLDENYIPMTVPRAASVSVGDILRVKSIDSEGKPTEWEAVSIPQSNWNQNDSTALNYVQNRPCYYDPNEPVTTPIYFTEISGENEAVKSGTGIPLTGLSYSDWTSYNTVRVGIYNDTGTPSDEVVVCRPQTKYIDVAYVDLYWLGNGALAEEGYGYCPNTGEDFCIFYASSGMANPVLIVPGYADSYLSIAINGVKSTGVYHKLDVNYIPTTVPRVASAAAGDMLKVKAIDDSGNPSEWETVNTTEIAEAAASIVDTSLLSIIGEVS